MKTLCIVRAKKSPLPTLVQKGLDSPFEKGGDQGGFNELLFPGCSLVRRQDGKAEEQNDLPEVWR